MKVLFDYQAFHLDRFGGVSNSFTKLIANLPPKIEHQLAIAESENVHLIESGLLPDLKPFSLTADNFITKRNFKGKRRIFNWLNYHIKSFPSSLHKNQRAAIKALQTGDYDIFHPTYFFDYFLPYLNGKPFVLTVHDMMPEIFSEMHRYDPQVALKRKLCPLAAHIVVVSEQTKTDLVRILGVPEEKITVIYHGTPKIDLDAISPVPYVDGDYFLYVGRRGAEDKSYKNFVPAVREFARFIEITGRRDIKLVCAGLPLDDDERALLRELKIDGNVISRQVNDTDLTRLYRHAIAFIYPSLYEGFGIPILEAYASKCPVMLNHKSCFPEIAGDAAVYFTLDSTKADLAENMVKVLYMSPDQRKDLIERQSRRSELYSWEKAANRLADVYRKVLSAKIK